MGVSQDREFISTRSDIIRDAFALFNIYGASESIPAADYELANRLLNRMVKAWMAKGYHLWLKETAVLFCQKDQFLYELSSSSSDHATLNYYTVLLAADASTGATFVIVDDASNIQVNDNIGIVLNDNSAFWTTVDSIAVNQINFPGGVTLSGDAAEGKKVYIYTTKLENPLKIYSGVRREDKRDVPLNYLSYQEYFELPNKEDSNGTPVSYNFDRQLNKTIIRLWQVPNNANILIKFTLSRKIGNFDVNSDEPDFPMEWHEPIVYQLGIRLAPAFRKNQDNAYQAVVAQANFFLQEALSFDNEFGSLYLRPDFHYG